MFRPDWFGLVTDHRRLFDALEDGWLRPLPSRIGSILGINAYLREYDEVDGNRIPVRIQLDARRLPDATVVVFRRDQWQTMSLSQVSRTDVAVSWPGVLPLFTAPKLTVLSEERRVRLLGMGKRISNIEIPDVSVNCNDEETLPPLISPPNVGRALVVPAAEDAVRGAMSMALWAVPHIDPWMNVLTGGLSSDFKRLRKFAAEVDAKWWRFPPWVRSSDTDPDNVQERLWLAAVDVLGSTDRTRPRDAADRIAAEASKGGSANDESVVEVWRCETQAILKAEATIQHDDWGERPVELAIQLVLSRPEPAAFKTWFDDGQVDLAPAVAWSAATLCGLFHGYRRLATRFRGGQVQREVVAVQALRMLSDNSSVDWPDTPSGPPEWRREAGNFVLSWGGRKFACKQERERGKWYTADLETDALRREAVAVAKKMDWPCVSQVISLREGRKRFSGAGSMEVREGTVKVRGDVEIHMSSDDMVEERVDHDRFRHLVAVAPGCLPAPTPLQSPIKSDEPAYRVPGLTLVPRFLGEGEEEEILERIDQSAWSNELSRRVQHYGWRYDYKARQVASSMYLGPLPEWAARVARRLFEKGYIDELPDQLIVNEYERNQGIAAHVDSKSSFADGVAMISLLDTWEMWFRKRSSDKEVIKLERRGAVILKGEARFAWTHEIPKRKTEPGSAGRVPRRRRISLTFRKVIGAASEVPQPSTFSQNATDDADATDTIR